MLRSFSDVISSIWVDVVMTVVCVISAAVAAGLTIGLVSLNQNELILLSINGTEKEKAYAKRLLPLLEDYHTLIVTLFLFNAVANEALPIFISGFVHKYYAVLIATALVLIFGEILPSSVFSGQHRMKIAFKMSPITKTLLVIFYPIAKPIGLLLDCCLGTEAHKTMPFDDRDLFTLLSLSDETTAAPGRTLQRRRRSSTCSESSSDGGKSHGGLSTTSSLLAPLMSPGRASHVTQPPSLPPCHRLPTTSLALPSPPPSAHDYSADLAPIENDSGATSHANDKKHHKKRRRLLGHDSVLIAQGAIVCGRKPLHGIVQASFVETNADSPVNLDWFEHLGRTGYSRVLVTEKLLGDSNGVNSTKTSTRLLGYIVLKELLINLHTYLNLPLPPEYSVHRKPDALKQAVTPLLVRDLPMHDIVYFSPSQTVLQALDVMQTGVSRIGALTVNVRRRRTRSSWMYIHNLSRLMHVV